MKKQTIITLVLAFLVTNYVSFQAGQTLSYYASRDARSQRASAGQRAYGVNQVLVYQPSRIDFGRIDGIQTQQRTVTFSNPRKEAVVIKQVKASCSCTMAIVEEKMIPAGGTGKLLVSVNPALASPELAVSISVEYEGKNQVDRLLVSGQVLKTQR